MKKLIIILLSVTCISFLFVNEVNSQSIIKETTDAIKQDGPVLHCRCKSGGCYGGNALSFRANCANFTDGKGDCNHFKSNCP